MYLYEMHLHLQMPTLAKNSENTEERAQIYIIAAIILYFCKIFAFFFLIFSVFCPGNIRFFFIAFLILVLGLKVPLTIEQMPARDVENRTPNLKCFILYK